MINYKIIHRIRFCPGWWIILGIFLFGCKTRPDKDTILLKVDDFIITTNDFNCKIKNTNPGLFDTYVNAGLIIKLAKENGYLSDPDIKKKIAVLKKQLAIEYLIRGKTNVQSIKDDEIKRSFKRFDHREMLVDYVWIPKGYKNIYNEIYDLFKNGMSVSRLIKFRNSSALSWKKAGVRQYMSLHVAPGTFINAIEKKIYTLKDRDFIGIETESGYHIIKQVDELVVNNSLPEETENIRQRLAIAKRVEQSDHSYDENFLKNSMIIQSEVLSSLNFCVDPVKTTEKGIVAYFKGNKITWNDMIRKTKLNPEMQSLLRHPSSRTDAVVSVIMSENEKSNPSITIGEKKLKAYIKKLQFELFIKDKLTNTISYKDTVSFLASWFNKVLQEKSTNSLYDVLKKDDISPLGMDKTPSYILNINHFKNTFGNLFTRTKNINYYNAEEFPDILWLKLDYPELGKQNTSTCILDTNRLIAYSTYWKLTIGEFRNVLKGLTLQSRLALLRNNNLEKLIEYLAKNDGGIKNAKEIKVDKPLLVNHDLWEDLVDSVQHPVRENDTIGQLGKVCITLSELRMVIADLPQDDKELFINNKTRETAFEYLLMQEFWFTNNQEELNKIENNEQFKKDLNKRINLIITKYIYRDKIHVETINTDDEKLNEEIRKAIEQLNRQRIESYLFNTLKNTVVEVDKEQASKLGIDLTKSKYLNYLHDMNQLKK